MDVKDSHSENAYVPIDLTEKGIFIDVRFLQRRKAESSIDVMFDDVIFTVFKLVHPLNVHSLIELTFNGIVMDVNDLQSQNA